jgi:hypothetical protein
MNTWNAERLILDLAVEDSFALSEIVARIRQAREDLPVTAIRNLARDAVLSMLARDLIEATRLDDPNAAEVPIDRDSANALLASDLAWLEVNHWRPHLRIVATRTGRELYYQNETASGRTPSPKRPGET